MKSQFLLFLFSLISCCSFGQKKYSFDYALIYDFQLDEKAKVEQRILLTNSKDNSYFLEVTKKDSLNYSLRFIDQNGYYSVTTLSHSDFYKAETITLDCASVTAFTNPYKFQVENYDFHTQSDSLVGKVNCPQYYFKSNNAKREKRKKLAILHFVVEKNTDFHQPVLLHPTCYEEWKLERDIPNGIPKLFYFTAYKTGKILSKYTLVGYQKADKYIKIPIPCPKFTWVIERNYSYENAIKE